LILDIVALDAKTEGPTEHFSTSI